MTWLRVLAARLLGRVNGDRRDEEFEEELRFHLEMEADANLRLGMPQHQARRAARVRLGGIEGLREKYRDVGGLPLADSCLQDVRYGVRMLAKRPVFTTVAVLSLALGIGATSTIFSVLDAAVLRPLPFREPDRLVVIRGLDPERDRPPAVSTFLAWRDENQTFEQMALDGRNGPNVPVSAAGGTQRVRLQTVGAHLFRLLGVEPVLGRTFVAEDFRDSPISGSTVVISFGLWQRLFGGDPEVLGQELTVGPEGTKTIVGVMPPGLWISPQDRMVDVWVADDVTRASPAVLPTLARFPVVGRLRRGVSVEQAQAELRAISRRQTDAGLEDPRWRLQVEPMAEWLYGKYAGTLYVLFGAVGCVLLIACLNVATLSVGRAAAQRTALATCLALGAGRWRVVRQLLTESLLLALLGGVVGVGLAVMGIKLFVALASGWYPATGVIRVDGAVLGFTAGLSLLTGIVSGVAPALRSSAVDLTDALKAGARGPTRGARRRISDLLVVAQTALALVLLVGAGLMLNSFVRLVRVDPGFRSDQLLTVRFDLPMRFDFSESITRFTPGAAALQQRLLERIEIVPEVDSVGLVSAPAPRVPVGIVGHPAAARHEPLPASYASYMESSQGYFRTLQIPLLKGRVFTAQDGAGAPGVAILNETFARQFFPGEDPLGARLQADLGNGVVHDELIDDRPRTIVGVVGDVKRLLRSETRPVMYVPYGQDVGDVYAADGPWNMRAWKRLVIRTAGDPLGLAAAVRTAMADVDPDLTPYDITTMDSLLADTALEERLWMQLLGLFAGLAVALAAIGLYGVIAYAVARRTHEIGVRTALGATRTDVFTLIVRQGLGLVLLGVGIGMPVALALTRVIASRLFGVTPTDPATLAAAGVLFVSIALAACALPALRATKVDPLVALRTE